MMRKNMPPLRRNDDAAVRRWRGDLFGDLSSPLTWFNGKYYEVLRAPRSVTFPICEFCDHVIWDWPHYEEAVPDHAVCEACAREDDAVVRDA